MDTTAQLSLVLRAMNDPRVRQALELALRDLKITADFQALRQTGQTVEVIAAQLAGTYCLSDEHIRTIIYNKKHARTP